MDQYGVLHEASGEEIDLLCMMDIGVPDLMVIHAYAHAV